MSFLRNNREYLVLALIVCGAFVMAVGIGIAFRGGNPPSITSFRSLVSALHF